MNVPCLAQHLLAKIAVLSPSGAQALAGSSPGEGPGWGYLVDASFHDGSLHVTFGPLTLLFAAIIFFGWLAWWFRSSGLGWGDYELVEATLKIGEIGEVKIAPNYETRQIAYQAWVELSTRKTGLAFDPDHDVIVEVYDSWRNAFTEIRGLVKSIPIHRLERSEETRKLVDLMIAVLNRGLRPHLTRWQAQFRRWYEQAQTSPGNVSKSPQAIQREFADYAELARDLQDVQSAMLEYREFLFRLARGER
jgi:hypothetical protein